LYALSSKRRDIQLIQCGLKMKAFLIVAVKWLSIEQCNDLGQQGGAEDQKADGSSRRRCD
jgi:hypothetical protein